MLQYFDGDVGDNFPRILLCKRKLWKKAIEINFTKIMVSALFYKVLFYNFT